MVPRPVNSIVNAVDFERVLKTATAARTPHFAVHHVAGSPALSPHHLSTDGCGARYGPVDDASLNGLWLGLVVPKRHARRSVTRSLLKRQIRAALQRRAGLADGLWVVRLRSPFDRKVFPSAASDALRDMARAELDALLLRAVTTVSAVTAATRAAGGVGNAG